MLKIHQKVTFKTICAELSACYTSSITLLIFFNFVKNNRMKHQRLLTAIHVIHVKLGILEEVIIRELDTVKVAILKHEHVLPQAT